MELSGSLNFHHLKIDQMLIIKGTITVCPLSSRGGSLYGTRNPHIGTEVPLLIFLSILPKMTYEPPLPFSRSDAFCTMSFLSVNGASKLVNPSSVRDCSAVSAASLSASFTGVVPSPTPFPFLFLTICRWSVYDCIGKAIEGSVRSAS